jgi:hypothetical protein
LPSKPLTWDQVKAKFEAVNPALKADADNVDEMKAEEITAFLRPNPQFTIAVDGTQIAPHNGVWTPFKGTTEQPNFSYLHERDHKRELRLESAQEGTRITQSQHEDLERNMVFALRTAFVERSRRSTFSIWRRPTSLTTTRSSTSAAPLQGRRHRADRSGSHRVASRAVRVGDRERDREPAHRQDPASADAQRPHAGGSVRRDRSIRFQR